MKKSAQWEPSRPCARRERQTGRETEVTKLTVASRNFPNSPKNVNIKAGKEREKLNVHNV